MKPIEREAVGEVLAKLYDCEINCRVEWAWDGGFVWVWNDRSYPRVWVDDGLAGVRETVLAQSDEAARASDKAQFLAPDWRARGTEPTIEEAVTALAEAINRRIPRGRLCSVVARATSGGVAPGRWLRERLQSTPAQVTIAIAWKRPRQPLKTATHQQSPLHAGVGWRTSGF